MKIETTSIVREHTFRFTRAIERASLGVSLIEHDGVHARLVGRHHEPGTITEFWSGHVDGVAINVPQEFCVLVPR
jgi:hypothetical protein